MDEEQYQLDYLYRIFDCVGRNFSKDLIPEYDPDWFSQFVNRVLLLRCSGDIRRFRLVAKKMHGISHIYAWIATAIRRNVVKLDLSVGTPSEPHLEIPKSLFMCSTLVRFKLWLCGDIKVMTPTSSNCFPSLKFLHVTLIIDGKLQYATAFNLDISAPKLKRLQIQLKVHKFVMDFAANDFVCKIFVNVDAPNLEEIDICFDALLKKHDRFLGLADRIHQIFAGICDVKYLTVRAPLLVALGNGHQHLLPTFNNLNYLELELHTCQCLQSLATVLMISPHLEHLRISQKWELYSGENNYCGDDNEDELEHGWDGCPDDMEVAKYLVKHGKALNNVTIYTPCSENKEMKSQSLTALWSKFLKFPRGSKTYLDEEEFHIDCKRRALPQGSLLGRHVPDWFAQYVNRVLLFRCPGDIQRFRLVARRMDDVSLIYGWIATAIRRNVVELDLIVGTTRKPNFEIPNRLFMCSTLVRLKLWLHRYIRVMTPTSSNCFPSLKFFHVAVLNPDSDSLVKLFSRCLPVLEELIIDGELVDTTGFNLNISAPKLKRLQIKLVVHKFDMIAAADHYVYNVCRTFINVDAPNLEEFDICFDAMAFDIGYRRLLPTFKNLNKLELQLQTCRCLQSLATLLKIPPNLEHLRILPTREHMHVNEYNYCDDDNEDVLVHEWDAPELLFTTLYLRFPTKFWLLASGILGERILSLVFDICVPK
ncbi:hypothetical protein ACLB2K_051342 [Fragaria x ananassa]